MCWAALEIIGLGARHEISIVDDLGNTDNHGAWNRGPRE